MKRLSVFLLLLFVFLSLVGSANALPFKETYTGSQSIGEGTGFNFGFDFINLASDAGSYNVTDSSLALTSDVFGVADPLLSASVFVDFIDDDPSTDDRVNIRILLSNPPTTINPLIGSITTEMSSGYNFSYDLTAAELAILNSVGWSQVRVIAVPVTAYENDFGVTRVAMSVNTTATAPVPEPATMLLLASGLLGLAGMRKRFKK